MPVDIKMTLVPMAYFELSRKSSLALASYLGVAVFLIYSF